MSVYIVSCARTPTGSFAGDLASNSAVDLGATAVSAAVSKLPLKPSAYEEIYFGSVLQANIGQSPAKQVALKAGLENSIVSVTINKVCASGMRAVICGAQSIETGHAEIVIAGGMESMSNAPYYVTNLRKGQKNPKYGSVPLVDALQRDGLSDAYENYPMGLAGERAAIDFGISREQQDSFAISSYEKATRATKLKKFEHEIVPVKGANGSMVTRDQEVSRFTPEFFAKARTAFKKNGTVTAPNSSPMSDGASAVVLVSERVLKQYKLTPLAKIVGYGEAEQEPICFPSAPAKAIPKALKFAGLSVDDIDFFEINEAFAVVGEANKKILNIPSHKINYYGGAVALGHALGSSGSRIIITLTSILKQEGGRYGVAAICNGGGGASAVVIEKCHHFDSKL